MPGSGSHRTAAPGPRPTGSSAGRVEATATRRGFTPVAVLAAVLAAALVAALAFGPACGPSLHFAPPDQVLGLIHTAADRASSAGRARVEVGVGERLAGSGVIDPAARRARLTLRPVRAGVSPGSASVEVAVDRSRSLVKRAGGGWLTGPPPALAEALRPVQLGAARLVRRPGAALDLLMLRGATDLRPYGGAQVRGTATMRHSVTIDLVQAADATPDAADADVLRAAAAEQAARFPADVWLDQGGRVRRVQLPADPEATSTSLSSDNVAFGVITIDYLPDPKLPPVTLPSPEEVHSLP